MFSAEGQLVFTGRHFFQLNIFMAVTFLHLVENEPGKLILTAGQFAWCPALNETPALTSYVY